MHTYFFSEAFPPFWRLHAAVQFRLSWVFSAALGLSPGAQSLNCGLLSVDHRLWALGLSPGAVSARRGSSPRNTGSGLGLSPGAVSALRAPLRGAQALGPRAQEPQFAGSRARAQEMQHEGSVAPRCVGSSWARDLTCALCIGRWIVIHQESLTHVFLTP